MVTSKWISSHFFSYACPVQGSETYLVVYDVNAYEASAGHTDYRDWSCSCLDWTSRRKKHGGYCKHIKSVMALKPEEGGMCLWQEDDFSKPVFVIDETSQLELDQWQQSLAAWGDISIAENVPAVSDMIKNLIGGMKALVPGLMYEGQMVVAMQAKDLRGTNVKAPRSFPDLDYAIKKQALLVQFAQEEANAAAPKKGAYVPSVPTPRPVPASAFSSTKAPIPMPSAKKPGGV